MINNPLNNFSIIKKPEDCCPRYAKSNNIFKNIIKQKNKKKEVKNFILNFLIVKIKKINEKFLLFFLGKTFLRKRKTSDINRIDMLVTIKTSL